MEDSYSREERDWGQLEKGERERVRAWEKREKERWGERGRERFEERGILGEREMRKVERKNERDTCIKWEREWGERGDPPKRGIEREERRLHLLYNAHDLTRGMF